MCQKSPLESLAAEICVSAKSISVYCQTNGYPHPSFERAKEQASNITSPIPVPQDILSARRKLKEAALKAYQLASDPSDFLPRQAVYFQQFACLHWLCHFRILSVIPLNGSIPYSEVALAACVPEQQLRSIARMAMTNNFLHEPVPGEVAHNATSALLVTNPSLVELALFLAELSGTTATKMVEATEKWGSTTNKNETAFALAMNTDLPFFDYLARSHELAKRFAGYMKNVTASDGTKVEHLLNGFDWEALGEARVVDVGGSSGHASIALASAFPKLTFIVQDLPETVSSSQANLSSLPKTVSSRVSFQVHDFFRPQPVKDADVYLLRMILHDWPAKEALAILKNLLPALKRGARLIIMDTVLPVPGSIPIDEESLLRVRDLTMMQTFNSQERELEDWTKLLAEASGGLALKVVKQPFGSVMSVMEVVYEGKGNADDWLVATEPAVPFEAHVSVESAIPIGILSPVADVRS